MSSPVVEVLRALVVALDGVGDGWYLFGAQAALVHGSRRLTSDVDVTVLPGSESNKAIAKRILDHGFTLRVPDVDEFVAQTRVLPFVHTDSGMPVDVVIGGPGLEELFLESSERLDVGGVTVPVVTAGHLVVMKLLAGRSKDLEDALAVSRAAELELSEIESLVEAIAEGLGEDEIRAAFVKLRDRLAGSG